LNLCRCNVDGSRGVRGRGCLAGANSSPTQDLYPTDH